MSDIIRIEKLLLRTVIGITPEERHNRQDVVISLALFVDTRSAGRSDDIGNAPVNYRTLVKKIVPVVEGGEFNLVEKLAADIARLCLAEPGVERVRVSVDKPGALRFAKSVGVTIERGRGDA
ncbi:dihydroneopterin aldolase [Geobacter sp. DSM 9736]|uniref:dihydroneopterin aldolase n=1 Tax=Geobacter sp. DSM 9736 TaxID=1277350 RepID=UPI000B50EA5A|nr:dihydroneopterin aldolase [Geobacter sp. DSM 9736]SNB47776.1 dihydroneopterin aldolase/D-erythro-7,8-dihydroneopterin triphosphate epimerase [Geobacter sp. DSM 9736]